MHWCCIMTDLLSRLVWTHSNVLYGSATLSVLMLDEAHERTLYTDIAIGLLKKVILVNSVGVKDKSLQVVLALCFLPFLR